MHEVTEHEPRAQDPVELRLTPDTASEQRGRAAGAAELIPVVQLPRFVLDCLSFDTLEQHPAVSPVLRAQLAQGERFRLIRLPFSLRTPHGAAVDEIRLSAEISNPPYVHSIYPVREEASQQTTRELSFSPSLTLGPLQLGTGRIGRTVVLQLATAVTSGYWGEKGADWILRRPDRQAPGLEGTWEFALILRWPGEISPVRLRLSASAVVSTTRFRWLTRRAEYDYGPVRLRGCKPVI